MVESDEERAVLNVTVVRDKHILHLHVLGDTPHGAHVTQAAVVLVNDTVTIRVHTAVTRTAPVTSPTCNVAIATQNSSSDSN